MTLSKIGRTHLILGSGFMVIGFGLLFDALSSAETEQPIWLGGTGIERSSWFFKYSYSEVEWFWGLCALAVGFIWVTGRVGWWIVRNLIQLWLHKVGKDADTR